jgi:hypothetical protein
MELSDITKQYWTDEDWILLKKAENTAQLLPIAMKVIKRIPRPRTQLCGPISTGGLGSIEKNLENFNNEIKKLQTNGLFVFDQMPFEEPMHSFMELSKNSEYLESILTDFYLPIFESGEIDEFYFLPDWKSSYGAKWEHNQAKRLGIKIKYL